MRGLQSIFSAGQARPLTRTLLTKYRLERNAFTLDSYKHDRYLNRFLSREKRYIERITGFSE